MDTGKKEPRGRCSDLFDRPAVDAKGPHQAYTKDHESIEIIRDFDFQVGEGEFVGIIGLSGCGKSTLLAVLAGLTPYQGGTLSVLGEPVDGPRRDIGFVFQHLALLLWRTVIDNVLLPAELLGHSRREAKPQALECLRMVGLDRYEKYYLREISGGMQQRVALSRLLMTQSRLLLLDEPFGALDELTRESVGMLFLDICQQTGAATVLVTHSIQEAVLMSDRILVMPPTAEGEPEWVNVDLRRGCRQPRCRLYDDGPLGRAQESVERSWCAHRRYRLGCHLHGRIPQLNRLNRLNRLGGGVRDAGSATGPANWATYQRSRSDRGVLQAERNRTNHADSRSLLVYRGTPTAGTPPRCLSDR